MKPGRSGAVIGSFPSDGANDGLVRLVARRQRADHLDQLHQRHGIEEVQAAEAIRTLRRRGELGDAQRRGVGDDDRVGPHDGFDRLVDRALLVEVLDDRFDDDVAVLEVGDARRAGQVAERRGLRLLGHLAFADSVRQEFPDAAETRLQGAVIHFADDRLVACARGDLRDSRSHQAASDDAHRSNLHLQRLHECGDPLAAADAGRRDAAL